jgi:hypothetical protein
MDPLSQVVDEALNVTPETLAALAAFRSKPKLTHLPGSVAAAERALFAPMLDELTDKLLEGVSRHPSKLWVLTQFQMYLVHVHGEDTELREHFGAELEQIMDALKIDSSDGLLSYYL